MSHHSQGRSFANVSFNASSGTPSINSALNATLTDDGVGRFTVNFGTSRPSSEYVMVGSAELFASTTAVAPMPLLRRQASAARTVSSCAIQVVVYSGAGVTSYFDCQENNCSFFGDPQ